MAERPLHQDICIAASGVVGAVVGGIGTGGNVIGIIAVGAAGAAMGAKICAWRPVDQFFGDALDFSRLILQVYNDPKLKSEAVAHISQIPGVSDRTAAEVLALTGVAQLKKDPAAAFEQWTAFVTSGAANGAIGSIASISNLARDAYSKAGAA